MEYSPVVAAVAHFTNTHLNMFSSLLLKIKILFFYWNLIKLICPLLVSVIRSHFLFSPSSLVHVSIVYLLTSPIFLFLVFLSCLGHVCSLTPAQSALFLHCFVTPNFFLKPLIQPSLPSFFLLYLTGQFQSCNSIFLTLVLSLFPFFLVLKLNSSLFFFVFFPSFLSLFTDGDSLLQLFSLHFSF